MNCCYSIKLIPIRFLQEGIKSGCALFAFIPSGKREKEEREREKGGDCRSERGVSGSR